LTLEQKLLTLFTSNEKSVVTCDHTQKFDANQKMIAGYVTLRRGARISDAKLHLDGKVALVAKPELENGTCKFAALDHDKIYQDEDEREQLKRETNVLQLPLFPFESKSKGIHNFAFFERPQPVEAVQYLFHNFAQQLGDPDAEVFPKEHNPGKLPFGIELPFFGDRAGLEKFTINMFADSWLNGENGHAHDHLKGHDHPEGMENITEEDVLQPGVAISVDFASVLARHEISCEILTTADEIRYAYHGIKGQGCLVKGALHEPREDNPRQSCFVREGSRLWHECFSESCRTARGHKTLQALKRAGISERELTPEESPARNPLLDFTDHAKKIATKITQQPQQQSKTAVNVTVEVVTNCFGDMKMEKLDYAWTGHLALGKQHHMAGNSAEGKSVILEYLATIMSVGTHFADGAIARWPDGTPNVLGPRSVLLMNAEDDPRDTVLPRLHIMGADVTKIHSVMIRVEKNGTFSQRMISLKDDLERLFAKAKTIKDLGLIGIDPITNYLGTGTKMNQEEEIRQILMPLALGARDLHIVVMTLGHLNRREKGTTPMHRIMGAAAFGGVSRFIYLVGPDPNDSDKHAHIMAQLRGTGVETLKYKTITKPLEWPDKSTTDVVSIEWRGTSTATAADAVDPHPEKEKTEEKRAGALLRKILAQGEVGVDDAQQQLRDAGYDVKTSSEGNEGLNWSRVLKFAGARSFRPKGERKWKCCLVESENGPRQRSFDDPKMRAANS
jgi:putative DNA primase/helicase